MRKEDRIRQQQGQNPSEQQPDKPEPRPSDQTKASASADQPNKPPRQPGQLPLPD
jgi:hypothetical protein